MKYIIYNIVNPIDSKVIYVGKTKNLLLRCGTHGRPKVWLTWDRITEFAE